MSQSGNSGRMMFGTILVVLGVLLLFAQFGWYSFGGMVSEFWPVILIVIGLWQWAARRFQARFWPIFLIGVGVITLAVRLGFFHARSLGMLAGILMVGFGLWLIVRKVRPQPEPQISDSDTIDHWVVFGGVEESVTSQNFTGGEATAVFGGIEIDMRQAKLAPGDVQLNLTAIFGGVEIRVPDRCQVVVDGSGAFGGVEDKTGGIPIENLKTGSRLKIKAGAIFGGIEIGR